MILIESTTKFNNSSEWLPYGNFIFYIDVSINSYSQPEEFNSDDFNFEPDGRKIKINQIRIINNGTVETIDKKTSFFNMQIDEESWYLDIADQRLYLHINHAIYPDLETLWLYEIKGYSGLNHGEVYYDTDDIEYQPLVKSIGNFDIEADDLKYSKIGFISSNINFDNRNGDFDDTINRAMPGSEITYSELIDNVKYSVYTGIVSEDEINIDECIINLTDKRSKETTIIPKTRFNQTDYPLLEDNLVGKIINEGYGELKGIPAVCITGTSGSGNQTYKYATDGTVFTSCFVKLNDAWIEKTPVSIDAINCEIVLSAADSLANGKPLSVKVNATLRSQTKAHDIIADMNFWYLGRVYDSDNYNTTEWTSEGAELGDIAILFSEEKDMFEYIEKMQAGSNIGFIYDITGDGKRTIRIDKDDRTPVLNLKAVDNLNITSGIRNFEDYYSRIIVKYGYDYQDKSWLIEENDSYRLETVLNYGSEKTYTIETLLTNANDAAELAQNLADKYRTVKHFYDSIKIKLDSENIQLKKFDIITMDFQKEEINTGKTGQREMFGEVNIKILNILPDSDLGLLTIKGRRIM